MESARGLMWPEHEEGRPDPIEAANPSNNTLKNNLRTVTSIGHDSGGGQAARPAPTHADADAYDENGDQLPEDLRPRIGEMHRGQVRMAYRLARTYPDDLMHVHGIGWHAWDGKRWVEDTIGAAKQAVLNVLRDSLADSLNDAELRQDVRRCESSTGVAGVLDIAAALKTFARTIDDLDKDPALLNCQNGTLNLRTMALLPHDPQDRITKVTSAAFRADATSALWDGFLGRVLPDPEVRGFLARYVGQALYGRTLEHRLAILTGNGRNGKGVTYGALSHALGDYAMAGEPDLLLHRDGAHPTGQMDLRGMRWVVVSESDEGRKMAEATVKRLTGGDKIKARRMRQDFVEFTPSHTVALVTNHLPKVSGDDPALWARLRVVPFGVKITEDEQDPELGVKLEDEADAILAWAVAGWASYNERGGLADPSAISSATEAYKAGSDSVGEFLDARTFRSGNSQVRVKVADLADAYEAWCRAEGIEPLSKRGFGEALDRRGIEAVKGGKGVRFRVGLALLTDEDEG